MEASNLTQQIVPAAALAVEASIDAVAPVVADAASRDGEAPDQQMQQHARQVFPDIRQIKHPVISSSSESESEEASCDPAAGTSGDVQVERVASPPPNCAICLGRCKNKCFIDSCMHQFCFKCLCEWSKVKPECPLCKQTFKSIIHYVKSIDQFAEYHVQPPIVQIAHPNQFDFPSMRMIVQRDLLQNDSWSDRVRRGRFVYTANNSVSVGVGAEEVRSSIRSLTEYNGEFMHFSRQEHPGIHNSGDTLSQLWRRYVYVRRLYAQPVCDINGRFRESSPQFYRDNPAQIHRLAPWIHRDVVCLMRQSHHDIEQVVEFIHTELSRTSILSPAFRRRLSPYLGNKAAHFIHELYNFARSPHDMFGYDGVVEYSSLSNEEVVIEFTSSDESNDNDIDVAGETAGVLPAASTNAINLTIHNRLSSNTARSADGIRAATATTAQPDIPGDVSLVIDLRGDTEAPSTATEPNEGTSTAADAVEPPAVTDNIELSSGSSDDCEFVLERKPPHLRTPEIVSLDSASDSDVKFVDETRPLSKATFSTSEDELDDDNDSDTPKRPTTRSKLNALLESKKARSDAQNGSELFNVGASTSAALRRSIQRRAGGVRTRRSKYALRNKSSETSSSQSGRNRATRSERDSSHSSSSLNSSSGAALLAESSTSDEEYVASTSNSHKRRKVRRSKNKNVVSSSKKSPAKRKRDNEPSPSRENGNGKFTAAGGHFPRQTVTKRYRPAGASDVEDDSDGEEYWRIDAVYESLRRRQQERAKAAKEAAAERKRRAKKNVFQRTVMSTNENAAEGSAPADRASSNSSDDSESDNLKLIELKSMLTSRTSTETTTEASSSHAHTEAQVRDPTDSISRPTSVAQPVTSMETTDLPATESTESHLVKAENLEEYSSSESEGSESASLKQGQDEHEQQYRGDSTRNSEQDESTNAEEITQPEESTEDNPDKSQSDTQQATLATLPTPLNLSYESNMFDGTSVSTSTADTILNDTAEQISSAAVNFYDPEPLFHTSTRIDYAETSNSSSTDSSLSSTSTSSSSSSSSSSNTDGSVNFGIS